MKTRMSYLSIAVVLLAGANVAAAKPEYEDAYYDGQTVQINGLELHQNQGALEHAAADIYVVVYPQDHFLWPSDPQCNPCDHNGNGDDPTDYHDHVLDSIPSNPGHGEYNALWHVFLVQPVSGQESSYASRLPMKSEEDIQDAIDAGVATKGDAQFYFLCAVVSPNAAH